MKTKIWSISTTVRNPNRLKEFLEILKLLEGKIWNNELQKTFQILLIQYRCYTPGDVNLSVSQIEILEAPTKEMTYKEAEDIFYSKNYKDPPMRGRTSFKPLEKWGLAFIIDKKVFISDLGNQLLNGEIDIGDAYFKSMLKWQYPNPLSIDFTEKEGYNIKPFVATLKIIDKVNKLCIERGEKAKGISREEFENFVLSTINYKDIDAVAEKILDYRYEISKISDWEQKNLFRQNFVDTYLKNYKNATISNMKDYADNIIRNFRLTRYIYIRGGGFYIDLEPRRMIEIYSIFEKDNAEATKMKKQEYINYLSDFKTYVLPWETVAKLKDISNGILNEVVSLENKLNQAPTTISAADTKDSLNEQIRFLRNRRTELQNLEIKSDFSENDKINECINAITNIRKQAEKPSVALEKWTNVALNIINDAVKIKPNYTAGDDNEPTFTAPGKMPDLEFYYETFCGICEVTLLTTRDQWYNEGQPVPRHLRDFEDNNKGLTNYCLFISPKLHRDTANTYWIVNKYEFEGQKQNIIPLNLGQLINILKFVKALKEQGKQFKHQYLKTLYDNILDISDVNSSSDWIEGIPAKLKEWEKWLLSRA